MHVYKLGLHRPTPEGHSCPGISNWIIWSAQCTDVDQLASVGTWQSGSTHHHGRLVMHVFDQLIARKVLLGP